MPLGLSNLGLGLSQRGGGAPIGAFFVGAQPTGTAIDWLAYLNKSGGTLYAKARLDTADPWQPANAALAGSQMDVRDASVSDFSTILDGANNDLTSPDDLSNAAWSKTGDTVVTANAARAPDGTMTAARVVNTLDDGAVLQSSVVGASTTKRIWARAASGSGSVAIGGFNGLTKYQVTLNEDWQLFEFASDTGETGGTAFYAVDFRFGTLEDIYIWAPQLFADADAADMTSAEGQIAKIVSTTNNLTDPGDLTTASWSLGPSGMTITNNAAIAPDGTMTATRLQETGVSSVLSQSSVVTAGTKKRMWARATSGTGTVAIGGFNGLAKYQETLTEDWQLFEWDSDPLETGGAAFYAVDFRFGTLTDILVWNPGLHDQTDLALGTEYIIDTVHVDADGRLSAVASSVAITPD